MPQSSGSHLAFVASVRCLECGAVYAKPAGGGIVRSNPGCPECGYLGWVAVSADAVADGPDGPDGLDEAFDEADAIDRRTAHEPQHRPRPSRAGTA